MGNKLVWRRLSTDDSHPKTNERKRRLENHSGMRNKRACSVAPGQCLSHAERGCERRQASDHFENLPEDVLSIILSKLPLNEVVKTSVLSKKWRHSWIVCSKLCFNDTTISGNGTFRILHRQHAQKFIDNVNTVLCQHHGRVVEELGIKFAFDPTFINHLNNWISFAVSAKTKFLSFNLVPDTFAGYDDRYTFPFPFELLDDGSISRLQCIRLSFVKFVPPFQFQGFPNLRKLDLYLVHASGKDFQNMLANCCKLEWLSMVRCHMNDELKVDHPLPCLVYFNVKNCSAKRIKLHAVNLTTFVYKGLMVTIDLGKASELENVNICFHRVTLEHVINKLPYELSNTQRLTLRAVLDLPKMPYLIENPCKFSQMKHLQLQFGCHQDINMSLVSILQASPSMEKLEMHFSVHAYFHDGVEPLTRLTKSTYRHMKDAYITGFVASKGQLEFLEHVAENAPALEVLTVDTTDFVVKDPLEGSHSKRREQLLAAVRSTARSHVEGKIPPTCCVRIH